MKSNPKTIAGVVVLVILAIGFGFLLSRMIPTAAEVQREMTPTPTKTPKPTDAPTPEPVLRTGSRGQEVKDLQSRLYSLGYYTGEIDGQFGAMTKEAVIDFQRTNGLEADGMVGSETKTLLFSANAKPKVSE